MSSADRESPFFRAWAQGVLRLRWVAAAALLAVTAFFVLQMKQHLRFDSSVEYFAAGSEARQVLLEFQEDFGNDTYHIVMIRGDVFSTEFLDRLRELHEELEHFSFDEADGHGAGEPAGAEGDGANDDAGFGGANDAVGFGDANDAAGFGASGSGDANDAVGFGAPGKAAANDAAGFGDANDAVGFGAPSKAAANDAAGFGDANDAAGFGDANDAAGFGAPKKSSGADDAAGFGAAGSGDDGWGDEGGSLIEEIVSLINVRRTVFEGGAVRVRGLLDGGTPPAEELAALREEVLGDPTLDGFVVGDDGKIAVIMLRTNAVDFEGRSAIYHALLDEVKPFDTEGFRVSVSGMPALNAELVETMQADLRRLIAAAFFVMALVLGFLFRSALGVVAPLVVVAMAAIWTLGSMAANGTPVTLLTNIIPAFLACVGLGDSIHVQAVHRDNLARGMSNRDAIISAIGSTGMPIVFTSLTTAVGLLSFKFAEMDAIAEMGVFAAGGVMSALLLSVTVLPIAMSFRSPAPVARPDGAAKGERRRDAVDKLLDVATALSAKRSAPVLAVGAALMVVAAMGISRIEVYHNPVEWLAEDYPARVEIERLDHHVGGTAQVNVVIEADGERGLRDLDLLQRLERFDKHVRDFEHPETGERIVTGTSSLLDIVKETNRALQGGDPDEYRLPDTQRGVSDVLFLFENASPRDLRRLATADLSKSHLTIRLHWMDATSYKPFTEWLEEGIQREFGDKALVRPTGSVYELVTTVGGLISDLLRSFGAALVSVTLMMVILLRSPTLGLISMIPNLVPVGLVMGFMGFAGIPLDLTNLLIASIVIGVAVDNTVHYVFQWKTAKETGAGTEGGIRYALEHAGRALVGTGFILALGFGVYLVSSMVNIRRFGMLVGSACVFALFTNLVFAPALLRAIFGRTPSKP